MSEQFTEVIDLLKEGEGGKAFHKLGELLHHKDGGVTALDDTGDTHAPPPPPPFPDTGGPGSNG